MTVLLSWVMEDGKQILATKAFTAFQNGIYFTDIKVKYIKKDKNSNNRCNPQSEVAGLQFQIVIYGEVMAKETWLSPVKV